MSHGFNRDVAPYPADHSVRMRMMAMPVDRPDEAPAPKTAKRRDGSECDVLATLGARPRGPVAPDDQVHDWRSVTR